MSPQNDVFEQALALERQLVLLGADNRAEAGRTWARLATLRTRMGDADGAIAAWQSAAKSAPRTFDYHCSLARARFAAQDIDDARTAAEDLLQQFPEEAFSHVFAGHVHKALGHRSDAASHYRRAIELDARSGEALYNLVESAEDEPDEWLRRRTTDLAECASLPVADQINALFAAARIEDRAGHYRQAFEYLRAANELARSDLARSDIRYDPAAIERTVARTIATYPGGNSNAALSELPVDLVPLFVIGPPRSGTTLIEQILSAHSAIQGGGELLAARFSELEFRRARAAAGREGAVDLSDPVDTCLLENARERYVDALFERGLTGPLVVDKLPANFEIAGFLRLIFPNAPIVHVVRDLRAIGFSLYNANFGAHEPWKHDLDDLAHYLQQYRRLMSHWHAALPAPLIEVVYEELVSEPERQIPALLAAIGLACEPGCLEFYRYERSILTASHAQVRCPAYTKAIDYWRNFAEWLGAVGELPPR